MAVQTDLRFTSTASADAFEVVEFHLREGLSETFCPQVELSCRNAADLVRAEDYS